MKAVETRISVRKMSSVMYDFKKNPSAAGYWGALVILYKLSKKYPGSAVCNKELFICAWPKIARTEARADATIFFSFG